MSESTRLPALATEAAPLEKWQQAVLHRLMIEKDASGLSQDQLFWFNTWLCQRYGLDPWGVPVKYLPQRVWNKQKRQEETKLVPYFGKECAEQLRAKHQVSITNLEIWPSPDSTVYMVKATAKCGERIDTATGAVPLVKSFWDHQSKQYSDPIPLQGEELSNAFLKCETKAKNRATYSILGMGFFMDASEAESLPREVTATEIVDKQTGEVQQIAPPAPSQLKQTPIVPSPVEAPGASSTETNGRPDVSKMTPAEKQRYLVVAKGKYMALAREAKQVGLDSDPIPKDASIETLREMYQALHECIEARKAERAEAEEALRRSQAPQTETFTDSDMADIPF